MTLFVDTDDIFSVHHHKYFYAVGTLSKLDPFKERKQLRQPSEKHMVSVCPGIPKHFVRCRHLNTLFFVLNARIPSRAPGI